MQSAPRLGLSGPCPSRPRRYGEQHTRDMLKMLIDASKVCMTWLRLERHGRAPNDQEACERSHSLLDRSLRDGRRARRLRARCLEGRGSLARLCLALAVRLTR